MFTQKSINEAVKDFRKFSGSLGACRSQLTSYGKAPKNTQAILARMRKDSDFYTFLCSVIFHTERDEQPIYRAVDLYRILLNSENYSNASIETRIGHAAAKFWSAKATSAKSTAERIQKSLSTENFDVQTAEKLVDRMNSAIDKFNQWSAKAAEILPAEQAERIAA